MKEYPKRPYFISKRKYAQLWIVVPLCIALLFCKEGFCASVIIICIWFRRAIDTSEQEWRDACDCGRASFYCRPGYLESLGFKEKYSVGVYKIPPKDEKYDLELQKEIEEKKKELEELIVRLYSLGYMKSYDDGYPRAKELYREIMKYYNVEDATLLITEAYNVLTKGGDIYRCKMVGVKAYEDYDYMKQFLDNDSRRD